MPTPERIDPAYVLGFVKEGLERSAEIVVPWFYANMPEYYFRTHSVQEQSKHLHAMISGLVTTEKQTVTLRSPDGRRVTYISPGGDSHDLLAALTRHVAANIQISRIYRSLDKELRLSTFLLTPQPAADPTSDAFAQALDQVRQAGLVPEKDMEPLAEFLAGAPQDYVDKFDPQRCVRHFLMLREMGDSEDVHVRLESVPGGMESRIQIAMNRPPASGLILEMVKILTREGLEINRAYSDDLGSNQERSTALSSFYVTHQGGPLAPESDAWKRLERELRLAKWHAPHGLEAFADQEGWPLKRVWLLTAAAEFAHQFLVKENLYAYTSDNITRALLANRSEAGAVVDWFEARFDPDLEDREARAARLRDKAEAAVGCLEDEVARTTLRCIIRFFGHTLRTNYFLDSVYGLGFRVDTAFLPDPERGEKPFGFYFFHGPLAQAFHVRYRDMARGGVRVVPTRSQEQFELESNRLFDEVTGLALAQQYKNKDIPEGGSKAVILLGPGGSPDLALKSMVNSLLDLVLPHDDSPTLPRVVDYLGRQEIIYLGPDENITPEHIVWIIRRAQERGYAWPNTFMSSKPGAGINHKEYGVTSLGVAVFALEILHSLGIDPATQPFTVKMTGGPKGDVAGNLLRILFRDYGDNCRVTAMTDGHGAAFDPDGLDHHELLRLVEENLSIHQFDPARLRGRGAFVKAADTPEGARARGSLHNTVAADLFLPCGGRPDTINMSNWERFLDENGKPTARAIVEGANLFITQDARDRLQDKGVLIVHGSSANKTGVICSSYEILGGLVMNEKEFLAIKDTYVAQVLDILKVRARDEARLMLREYRACDGCKPLTQISMELSKEINILCDKFYAVLQEDAPDLAKDPDLGELLFGYCPPVLVDKFRDRILRRVPRRHQYAVLAAHAASRIVYAEGVGWMSRIAALRDVNAAVRAYLRQEKRLAGYVAKLRKAGGADEEEMARILEASGRKFLTGEALGLE